MTTNRSTKKKALLFIAPALITIAAITIFPLSYSFFMNFTLYYLVSGKAPKYIGLENWGSIFTDTRFWTAMLNTTKVLVPSLLVTFVAGMFLAILLNRKLRARGLIITLLSTPVMIAPVASGLSFRLLLNPSYGPINDILGRILAKNIQVDWLGTPSLAIYAIAAVDIWKNTPYVMLIILAGLSSISEDIYEAAIIDGASSFQIFRCITLPLLSSVIIVAVVIRTIDLVKLFDLIFILTMGGPGISTETVSFYTYLVGLKFFRIGYGASLSIFLLVTVIALVLVFLRIMRKGKV